MSSYRLDSRATVPEKYRDLVTISDTSYAIRHEVYKKMGCSETGQPHGERKNELVKYIDFEVFRVTVTRI